METSSAEKKSSKMMEEPTYDPTTRTLTITFKKGSTYNYRDFPEDKFKEFHAAPSWGKFFGGNRSLFANGVKQVSEDDELANAS